MFRDTVTRLTKSESLPYENDTFDLVLSQFGHMFAPRPEVAISEMLRVLKPGGRIAFSTWPPDHFVAKLFKITAKFASPVPDMPSPTEWGDPNYVQLRLENKVRDLMFDRSYLSVPVLSPQQARELFEKTAAPLIKLVNDLKNDPETLSRFRAELEALIISYTRDNILPQHYLMSRATKI